MTARIHRWTATVLYRTESGPLEVVHDLEEIDELDALIEGGPHWDTIVVINIVRAELIDGPITVEQARAL